MKHHPSPLTFRFCLVVLTGCLGGWPAALPAQTARGTVEFARDIQPIFEKHCYECHGKNERQGGFKLDDRDEVLVGGFSGNPLLGGTLETNEIYLRVSSDDETYRMPKRHAALTTGEIAYIKQWVEQGTPWPDTAAIMQQLKAEQQQEYWSREAWYDYGERWLNEVPGLMAWLKLMLFLQFFLLLSERCKTAMKKQAPWITTGWGRSLQFFKNVGAAHYLAVVLAMLWLLSGLIILGQQRQIVIAKTETSKAKNELESVRGAPTLISLFGNPPVPHRPKHPARVAGEYYRGNCERSPKLFNGGNYRTATFRLTLVDKDHQPIEVGAAIPDGGLFLKFEMERAPQATKSLFTKGIIESVMISQQLFSMAPAPVVKPVYHLETAVADEKWETYIDLEGPQKDQKVLSGLLYLYQGRVNDKKGHGEAHYGIKYDLKFQDGKLQQGSDIWMGVLFAPPVVELSATPKLPLKEWFSDEEIPVITGENTTDPTLLGLPEHEAKLKKLKEAGQEPSAKETAPPH